MTAILERRSPAPAARLAAAPAAPAAPDGAGHTPAGAAALELMLGVLHARSLAAAAHALAAALATRAQCSGVTIGLRRSGRTVLLASSALDVDGAPAELPPRLIAAMDEAIEQAVALQWPPPGELPPATIPAAFSLAHREWQRSAGGAVATVPLGRDGEPLGAVCLERIDGPAFSPVELAALQELLCLALPALHWIDEARQPWARRVRRALGRSVQALRQPRRRGTRRVAAAGLLLLLGAALVPLPHELSGRARIEGVEQRVLSAPADGFVKEVRARPGDRVRAGDPLIELLDSDLRVEQERWRSQLVQHENDYAAAMARSDRAAAAASLARGQEAQAQLDLIDEQLRRGRISAPFDGLVLEGDLGQSIGAPVRQGDRLVTVARGDGHRVIVEIDETDIARVVPGQPGTLALSALPWQRQPLVVERITPLARTVDGRNVFEVEARLAAAPPELRPGLLGRATVVVGRRPPLWAWGGRALDRLRLAWWSWFG